MLAMIRDPMIVRMHAVMVSFSPTGYISFPVSTRMEEYKVYKY